MVQAALFIPLVIVAITQMVKMAFPQIQGWLTILIAFVVGVVVALVSQPIGLDHLSIAQGIVYALEAVGVTVVASKAGGGSPGDQTPTA